MAAPDVAIAQSLSREFHIYIQYILFCDRWLADDEKTLSLYIPPTGHIGGQLNRCLGGVRAIETRGTFVECSGEQG